MIEMDERRWVHRCEYDIKTLLGWVKSWMYGRYQCSRDIDL